MSTKAKMFKLHNLSFLFNCKVFNQKKVAKGSKQEQSNKPLNIKMKQNKNKKMKLFEWCRQKSTLISAKVRNDKSE